MEAGGQDLPLCLSLKKKSISGTSAHSNIQGAELFRTPALQEFSRLTLNIRSKIRKLLLITHFDFVLNLTET